MDPSLSPSTVSQVMSHPVVTATMGEPIAKAAARMRESKVGSVVVVEGTRPVGILTERDLVGFAASGADPATVPVSEWMTRDPDTVEPATDVTVAFRSLSEGGYRHFPVVERGALVGIVSMRDLMKIAQILPAGTTAAEVPRGLKGVVAAETSIGDVRGEEGFYHYRQYEATDLARTRSLEEVWFLLYDGRLPSSSDLENFRTSIDAARVLPEAVAAVLPSLADSHAKTGPLGALRTACSLLGGVLGFRPTMDLGRDEIREQAVRMCSSLPVLAVALYRLGKGSEPIAPRPDLGSAANFLYMLEGEEPDPIRDRALEQYLILTADHGFNSSTFTARVITSTGADLGAAVAGAIGALSGPLHGGAPSRALDMLDDIGSPERVDDWLRAQISRGERVMGFGHAVYRTEDPRSRMLLEIAERLGGTRVSFAKQVESRAVALLEEMKPGRRLYTNVEFYASVVLEAVGLPRELFTPAFACSRSIGWTAHVLEQSADNRIIRPSARYVGPPPGLGGATPNSYQKGS